MSEMKTLSGIAPAKKREIPYEITTADAEAFLQKKFDAVILKMNEEIKDYNKTAKDRLQFQEEIEVNLITNKMSAKFHPFILILPASVLEDKSRRSGNDELDIFNPQHTEHNVNIKKCLYQIIQPFLYDDNDKRAFFSTNFQHSLKISSRTAGSLKANCRPKIHRFNKEGVSYVVTIIDPLRLFHNMLTVSGDDTPFDVFIDRVEQMKGGNFRYYTIRAQRSRNKKHKGNNNFDLEKIIARNINGR